MKRAVAVLPLSTLCLTVSLTAGLALGGCKSNKGNEVETAPAEPAEADAGDVVAEAGESGEAAETGEAAGTGETGTAETGGGETGGGETGGDEAAAAETGGETAGETAEADAITPLLDEVKNTRTKDDRAMKALAEAKAAGAEPRALAEAANKRGEKLMTKPERATEFFEWARKEDETYPNASFNLAKLAANTGEVATVKELLQETKDRGGKKLLKTVGFDPTFALVADDPDVVALTK